MGNIQNGRNRPSKIRTLSAAFLLLSGATAFASDVATIADSPYQGKKLIISMQYDWEPLSFKDDSGNPTGYFYDIATEAAKRLGATVEITSGDFAAVIPAIQSGKFDTAVGLDATVARQEVVDVVSHVIAGYRLLVPAKSTTPDTQDLTAFCGLTIALLASHPAQGTFEETSKKCEAEGKKPITVSLYPDRAATFLAVKSVRADGTAGYTGENGWLLRKDPDLKVIGPIFDTTYAGVPLKKGSEGAVFWQKAINSLIADGTYAKILTKYGVEDVAIPESLINPAK
ncbi:transporter substrate-binding domain-containing protein (plasmid) [Agrobacterium tumefaciens]|uniref:Transporter substrate-binding domain-containing protein n=1 Tax=Agrobacterium tumefaciens TaxID=358 RepID=A0AAP9EAD1_AGRTU|nr:transporter substrate-binding domain-containing protein [Agrobacterium tumefaciens]NSZ60137.1 transporter substrate-binding domain-containing protein [Agrobacterium tumefaciens]NTZ64198.1 transporter substrate-binding domain-containing protein [Agrobacterium tumefaciens]QDY97733.2 transporter substrate-binding domain-containing protein [Agrobacterium tumefaciens]UXS12856.1 transporter substrate-binding domain-containing protein [Agrobacterium tumefaciens]UXS20218.1 transporter substrate-bin